MRTKKVHNGGTWTAARKRSFIISALRKARWPQKYEALKRAYVSMGLNPASGRQRKMYRCAMCGDKFGAKEVSVDHIDPVVDPYVGFQDFDTYVDRLYVEAGGFQVLCSACHAEKTASERRVAEARKAREKA